MVIAYQCVFVKLLLCVSRLSLFQDELLSLSSSSDLTFLVRISSRRMERTGERMRQAVIVGSIMGNTHDSIRHRISYAYNRTSLMSGLLRVLRNSVVFRFRFSSK